MFITSIVATSISTLILILGIPGIIAGYGLLKKKSWSRILILILAAFNLLNIPFGTMLGGYTFWVMLQDEYQENYYDRLAAGTVKPWYEPEAMI